MVQPGSNNNYTTADMESLDELLNKLAELEQRVVDAEGRAVEAEDKVRMMEQRLAQRMGQQDSWDSTSKDKDQAINKLESQVEEQRQLRLQEAKQVEAKAARIKEWVTNKLRELEEQNQLLREQNQKCNHQLELLRNHLAQTSSVAATFRDRPVTASSRSSLCLDVGAEESRPRPEPRPMSSSPASLLIANALNRRRSDSGGSSRESMDESVVGPAEPLYSEVDPLHKRAAKQLHHRRQLSASAAMPQHDTSRLADLGAAVEGLVLVPARGAAEAHDDMSHDYAEIYTPSRERVPWTAATADGSTSSGSVSELSTPKPPTPPLHRFPSWESRIYQVAAEGLQVNSSCSQSTDSTNNNSKIPSGYCDISVPVYATVKGRASQIRSMPFTGDSSDDSSDGEGDHNHLLIQSGGGLHAVGHELRATNSSSENTESSLSGGSGSSPSKSLKTTSSLSPAKQSSSGSPSKSIRRDTSLESGLSEDYAIPPDAFSGCETSSIESSMPSLLMRVSSYAENTLGKAQLPIYQTTNRQTESLEKSGHLAKLGGKLKTWRKRWFVLKNGILTYWKSQSDVNRKPQGQIVLDEICRINRAEGAATFEISTGKKTYYLTADSIATMEDWIRILQNVQRRNAAKLLLSKDDNKPTIQGWLTKVKNGHARKCWCVLLGKMFLYFKTPSETNPIGQINMRDARVEEVDHVSDSDSEEQDTDGSDLTIGIFPTHQGPTYLLMPSKQERDTWLYHLTVVSGGGPNAGTQYEQLVQKLMETDGDANCVLWRHPHLLHSKEPIASPLTTLNSPALQAEAVKLFKCCQLFISVALEQAGIDYHVVLAQNALQQCLDMPDLQNELLCALVKQTSRHVHHKGGVQVNRSLSKLKHSRHSQKTRALIRALRNQLLLCATQSLFTCDSSSAASNSPVGNGASLLNNHQQEQQKQASQNAALLAKASASPPPTRQAQSVVSQSGALSRDSAAGVSSSAQTSAALDCKTNPAPFVFVQGWQLLALAVSLFIPKNNKLLWYLKLHLRRNADTKTECGKYAAYCERALERTIQNGSREAKPSRMEVLSILLKNPYHHSLPHAIPVHMLNGAYQVVSFDGSTTIEEFLCTLSQEIGCRDASHSGFTLFSDDPIEKDLEHFVELNSKLCDVISKWETALREKGSGKFENTRVIQLTFKNRLYFRSSAQRETDRERLLLCYQVNQQVVQGRFPLNRELALELASLMAQIDLGEYNPEKGRGSGGAGNHPQHQVLQALDKFYPYRYRDGLTQDGLKDLQERLIEKWVSLKGRSTGDCVRIYLTCTRKWPYFGSGLFQARFRQAEPAVVWLAVSEDSITLLELGTMQALARYAYTSVVTFGGCQEDFMLVVSNDDGLGSQKLLFSLSKPKILELTVLIADYMNAMGRTLPGTPQMGSLTRNSSHRSLRSRIAGPQVPTNSIGPSTALNTLSSVGSHMLHGTLTSHGHATLSSHGTHHPLTNSTLSGPVNHSGNTTLSSLGSHGIHLNHGPSSMSHQQPDILKSTPDHSPGGVHRTDSKKRHQIDGGLT
ncbi:uncharacterized protein CG43867 isoform X4 [Frankliniella occidentalis]|uniref:Uncharacterized protein CG43867 isoform X4 n=1 Tax=Frankliniella occidentalis TaxID=133901 RepID=A0A9C6U4Q2_FRAOC|nr:uncharacterized protein CG43867 isoform X4 [Frankliniella occidentalis]